MDSALFTHILLLWIDFCASYDGNVVLRSIGRVGIAYIAHIWVAHRRFALPSSFREFSSVMIRAERELGAIKAVKIYYT